MSNQRPTRPDKSIHDSEPMAPKNSSPLNSVLSTPTGKYDALFGGDMNAARDRLRDWETSLRQAVKSSIHDGNDKAFSSMLEEWFRAREAIEKMSDAAWTWARWQFPQVSPLTRHNTEEWIKANPWFDIRGEDDVSRRVLEIDDQLVRDGFDPEQQAYWAELDSRLETVLPGKRWKQ
jgi:hypothetical protein